jgi:hypothetical protein
MRDLWSDHVDWTRLFIVSAANGLADLQSTTDRLLKNQTEIGNAVKEFYGEANGNELTRLLKDHITIAAEVVTAAKAGDNTALTDANTRWFANADSIAAFLNTANPTNWPLADMKTMMHEHLTITTEEATKYLQGDYAGSIDAWERVQIQIQEMADMLADGITKQKNL